MHNSTVPSNVKITTKDTSMPRSTIPRSSKIITTDMKIITTPHDDVTGRNLVSPSKTEVWNTWVFHELIHFVYKQEIVYRTHNWKANEHDGKENMLKSVIWYISCIPYAVFFTQNFQYHYFLFCIVILNGGETYISNKDK